MVPNKQYDWIVSTPRYVEECDISMESIIIDESELEENTRLSDHLIKKNIWPFSKIIKMF